LPGDGGPEVEVNVVERAYLGEFWDYVVVPVGGTTRLKVVAPPLAVHEVGETAWLAIDPRQVTPIQ
jgi:iron(III) transport system ATP-binding protein